MDQGYEDNRFENAVDKNFHCPICMNVLKEPVQCRNNEHYFCSPCIRRHLEQNSPSCPLCIEELTIETLRQPPKILTDYLSSLKITCDHADRGCREIVELEILVSHVANCNFSPVICSNDGCMEVVNKQDVENHETNDCGFKKIKCDDCDKQFPRSEYSTHGCVLRREVVEMKEQMMKAVSGISTEVKAMREEMKYMTTKEKVKQSVQTPKEEVKVLSTEVKAMREEMKRMTTEVNNVKHSLSLQNLSCSNCNTNSRKDIVAVGGSVNDKAVAFAEKFSWVDNKWTLLQPMKENRSGAAAVVFENKILVCGGKTSAGNGTDSIEVMDMNQKPEHWLDFPAKLPLKCRGHQCVVYGNRLLVIGGYTNEDEASDGIYEVLLVPPYSSKLLCRMKLRRCYHRVALFDEKILIFGGSLDINFRVSFNNVEMYDITKNECKEMVPLPSAVSCMATVCWDDNVILMGGCNDNYVINTVIAYNIKTGESKVLPSMRSRRQGCAAIVSENKIVVMGGYYGHEKYLSSVECFDFLSHSWIELPSMMEPRFYITVV